jgi:hypothetical protein
VAVHIYTQTINRTTQITTNVKEYAPCPVFASFTLAFALQLRKIHRKTSVRVRKTLVRLRKTSVRLRKTSIRLRKTSVSVRYTYYQNTHTCCTLLKAAPVDSHFFNILCPSWCCPLSFAFPFLYFCTISSNVMHILGFVNVLPEKLLFYCFYWRQRLLISVFRNRLNGFSIYHSLCISLSGLVWRL